MNQFTCCCVQHDESLQRSGFTGEHTFLNPLREKPAEVQRTEMINSRKYKLGKHISFVDDAINFNALCRGENLLVIELTIQLNRSVECNNLCIIIRVLYRAMKLLPA